jgi:hypothetical protein
MRKPQAAVLIILLMAQGMACPGGKGYELLVDDSVYSPRMPPAMAGWGENVPYYREEGEKLYFQGTYALEPYGRIGMVRQFDRRKGWSYVTLAEPLPVEGGTLVEVRGTVMIQEQPIRGTGRINRVKQLHVEDHQVLYDARPLLKKARREYGQIREGLQKEISLPGSKLKLSENPDWRVDWLRGERLMVVVAHFYDLMYAAEAQFLFSMEDQDLKTVYFHEWFKGE